MADERREGNSPPSTSEATPPQVDDSPEMVNQPSPPEEERVSSSTDRDPPEVADSPDEPSVSSTSDLQQNVGEESPTPSDSDASQEVENQPRPDAPPDHVIRELLESPPALHRGSQQTRSPVQDALIKAGIVGAALAVPMDPVAIESVQMKSATEIQERSSQEIATEANKQNVENSDDSNQQFDADDSSPVSKSPDNADLKSDSSPSGSDVHEDELRASESSVTETAVSERDSSPRKGVATKKKIVPGIVIADNVELESRLSPSKTDSGVQVPGSVTTETIGLSKESSPSKTGSGIQVSGSGTTETTGSVKEQSPLKSGTSASDTTERKRDAFSPKRKSPTNVQHLHTKRYAPCQSPDKRQSDSQMSVLLEDLDIKGTETNRESTEPVSVQEQEMNLERVETLESQNEDMEVQETDSRIEHGETPKCSENDDAKMEESD